MQIDPWLQRWYEKKEEEKKGGEMCDAIRNVPLRLQESSPLHFQDLLLLQ